MVAEERLNPARRMIPHPPSPLSHRMEKVMLQGVALSSRGRAVSLTSRERELLHEIEKLLVRQLRKLDPQLGSLALNAYAREIVWWSKQYALMGFNIAWNSKRQRFECTDEDEGCQLAAEHLNYLLLMGRAETVPRLSTLDQLLLSVPAGEDRSRNKAMRIGPRRRVEDGEEEEVLEEL